MTRPNETLKPGYFDAIYASDPDPWKFATSAYERGKYALTLSSLQKPRYDSALEVGCSVGVLSHQLGLRCDRLLAIDSSEIPLIEARRRCAELQHIRFDRMFVPMQWPDGTFDLILLSEIIYYLSAADVAALATRVGSALVPGGDVVLVHWTGETDYPLTGDEAAECFISNMDAIARIARQERYRDFRIDVLIAL
jgi:cyclopropane fatty-acyl-phospholipid synthase-like methyltransferase